MPPKINNNRGTVGRAMSGAGDRRDIARAGDFQTICECLAKHSALILTMRFGVVG